DNVVRVDVDVVGRLVNERPKGGDRAPPVSLQEHPRVGSSCSGYRPGCHCYRRYASSTDHVDDTLRRRGRRNTRRSSLAQPADHGCVLFHERHDGLWLDSTVLEGSNNGILHLHLGATERTDCTSVRNGNVALHVDGLIWNCDEIAGAHATLAWNEEPSRGGFE